MTAEAASAAGRDVTHFEGTPIPTSALLVFLLAILAAMGRIGEQLPLGGVRLGPFELHPFVLSSSSRAR